MKIISNKYTFQKPRYPKAYISTIATNSVHLRNPWVTAWWSAAFPGFGHIILGNYIEGFLLVIWEIVVNLNAKINAAIVYSFTGQFEKAKAILSTRWVLIYVAVFVYAIWDSYRTTIDLNKYTVLAEKSSKSLIPFKMDSFEINYFNKRNPWVAAGLSFLMPGIGHLYTRRLTTGFFILVFWIGIHYYSRVLEAIHYSMVGEFAKATSVLNPEWYLFLPSLVGFCVYDSYVNAVECNKLFDWEQAQYLKKKYQDKKFKMPF